MQMKFQRVICKKPRKKLIFSCQIRGSLIHTKMSRIRNTVFNPKKLLLSFQKYGLGIRDPESGKKLIADPDLGVKRHRIPDLDPQH
jgi:hypothetical protein